MLIKQIINEDVQSDRINFIVDQIKTNPEVTKRVYRLVQNEIDSVSGKSPAELLAPELTKPEQDHTVKGLLGTFIRALNDTPGDYDDFSTFLTTYGQVSYINEAELIKPGFSGWGAWLQGNGKVSEGFITQLYKNLFDTKLNIQGSNRGPGEVGLALLSPNIKFASIGDLSINGTEVEVKGEISSGGGRLKNNLKDFGKPNLDPIYAKAELEPDEIPVGFPTGNAGAKNRDHFQDIAKMLDTKANMLGQEYMKELFNGFFINGDPTLINNIVANYDRLDRATISRDAMIIAYSSYANILKTKGFSMFLLLKLQGEKSVAFDLNDYQDYLEYFKLGSLDFNDTQNGPAVQISML